MESVIVVSRATGTDFGMIAEVAQNSFLQSGNSEAELRDQQNPAENSFVDVLKETKEHGEKTLMGFVSYHLRYTRGRAQCHVISLAVSPIFKRQGESK